MATRRVTIGSTVGLHARPAMLFVEAVNATGVQVTIAKADAPAVAANSILSVMALGAKHGDEVVLEADGDAAEDALNTLAEVLESNLDAQ